MVRKSIVMPEDLVRDVDALAGREQRDFSGALRYALRIGLLAVENPEFTVEEIKEILAARTDHEAGRIHQLDLDAI